MPWRIFLISMLCTLNARADYGWIPEYHKLTMKAGLNLFRSSENFDTDGERADIRLGSGTAEFAETRFFLEPEFGIAEDWAIGMRAQFLSGSVDRSSTGDLLASGGGLGDTYLWLKYNFKSSTPVVTLESRLKFPTGQGSGSAADDLVTGDGNFDANFVLHTGHRIGRVYFSLSPGFLARSGNYAPAITGEASFRVTFPRGYIRASLDGIFSLVEEELGDSSLAVHDAIGSGGTYARLSGSPTGITIGGVVGFRFFKQWAFEMGASHGVMGVRYPNGLTILTMLRSEFDFFEPETKKKIREIPLESEGTEKFYDND